jgi:hypothetical protein
MRAMPAHITCPALAAAIELRLRRSFELLAGADPTPSAQRAAAWEQATLPLHMGGVVIGGHSRLCTAAYAASIIACWPSLTAAVPDLSALNHLTTDLPMLASFRTAYSDVRAERARIADIYVDSFDTELYYAIDADRPVSRYHPKSLPPASSLPDLSELLDPKRTSPTPAQRTLAKVAHHAYWLACMDAACARDSAPTPLTAVRNREATRLIATSMPSSGAWLDVVPDNTARNQDHSLRFEVALQRRLGLYIAHAVPTVRELLTAGQRDVDYFGDSMANGGEYNRRHNSVNYSAFEAVRAVAVGSVLLGDKGQPQQTAHLNSTHVLDIAEIGGDENTGGDCLYETKCANPLVKSLPVGRGSHANGGAPASMGHRLAFGNTAEPYRCLVYGCAERGFPVHGPLCHTTGTGWVAKRDGQYADALSRKTKVCLVLVESLGGIYYGTKLHLHTLSKRASGTSAVDRTHYGRAAASPRSFMQNHSQRLSRAAVMGDAAAICKKVIALKQQVCLLPRGPVDSITVA